MTTIVAILAVSFESFWDRLRFLLLDPAATFALVGALVMILLFAAGIIACIHMLDKKIAQDEKR